jgi:hypothetical protein
MSLTITQAIRSERRKTAEQRVEAWRALSVDQQLSKLDQRPGKSQKERAKLARLAK